MFQHLAISGCSLSALRGTGDHSFFRKMLCNRVTRPSSGVKDQSGLLAGSGLHFFLIQDIGLIYNERYSKMFRMSSNLELGGR